MAIIELNFDSTHMPALNHYIYSFQHQISSIRINKFDEIIILQNLPRVIIFFDKPESVISIIEINERLRHYSINYGS